MSDKDYEPVVLVLTRRDCTLLLEHLTGRADEHPLEANLARCVERAAREQDGDPDAALSMAQSIIERAYYADVRRWGADFIARIQKGEWASEDAFQEAFDQETDSALIYCHDQWNALTASRKRGEAWDELRDMGIEPDESEHTLLAPWALLAFRLDLREEMGDFSDLFNVLSEDDSEGES
jgi:hypothetical protein